MRQKNGESSERTNERIWPSIRIIFGLWDAEFCIRISIYTHKHTNDVTERPAIVNKLTQKWIGFCILLPDEFKDKTSQLQSLFVWFFRFAILLTYAFGIRIVGNEIRFCFPPHFLCFVVWFQFSANGNGRLVSLFAVFFSSNIRLKLNNLFVEKPEAALFHDAIAILNGQSNGRIVWTLWPKTNTRNKLFVSMN